MKYDWHMKDIGLPETEIQNGDKIALYLSGDLEISHTSTDLIQMRTVYVLTSTPEDLDNPHDNMKAILKCESLHLLFNTEKYETRQSTQVQ
jgi:hypothetical protein